MKLIIDIPHSVYEPIIEQGEVCKAGVEYLISAIQDATPLTGTIIIDEDGDMHKVMRR